ncbi:MAG TPA: sigma-54 dependent transcriptional regulator [Candidatus Deferrimicrobium sp.]|nr:sigma-54 dependent transcriptional regulator [Candidatus Deferrimicrobium sp.]
MAGVKAKILVADDEESVRGLLTRVLVKQGYLVETAVNGEEVLNKVREKEFQVLIMDIRMPKLDGMEAFKLLRRDHPALNIIMMTAFSTAETTLEAMRLGAFDYLTKPFDLAQIKAVISKAVNSRMEEQLQTDEDVEKPWSNTFVGSSVQMLDLFKTIGRVAPSDSSVLIQGESGTGKELIARTIHEYSNRKQAPFVSINCGAVPEGVLESEFFGHEKGAFTGAHARKIGKFEFADGGTIFLDEIGEMSPQLQVKLLRVLQERQFERVGGNETVAVDIRVIAATNKDLRKSISEKSFRADLYYRLNVVSITVPSLRERMDDIVLLAAYFRDKYCAKLGKQARQISQEALVLLECYPWPGNVRELENAIEHAIVMGKGGRIMPEDLPEEIANYTECTHDQAFPTQSTTLKEMVKAVEKTAITQALLQTRGNKLQAAKRLDISRRALQYKIEEYGISDLGAE